MTSSILAIEKQIKGLPMEEQLELLERIIHNVKSNSLKKNKVNIASLYGSGKGLWDDDAQEYVNREREDRI